MLLFIKKIVFPIFLMLFTSCLPRLYSESDINEIQDDLTWRQINGRWEIVKGIHNYITDNKVKSYRWGYNELINHNTIITLVSINGYDRITYNLRFVDPLKENVRFMSNFGIKEDRIFSAFRFTGDAEGLNKIEFIRSVVMDPQKPANIKWNYVINSLNIVNCSLKYNTDYFVEIIISDKKTTLKMNDKTMISSNMVNDEINSGQFGFSSLHVKPMIWDIKVYNRRKLVFSEDFSTDRVRRIKVRGTIEKK